MNAHDIILGPYLVEYSSARTIDRNVSETGIRLEFATPENLYCLPIFRCIAYDSQLLDFDSLFLREVDLPFETPCWNFQLKSYIDGPYVAITAFLAELYKRFSRLIPIQKFLTNFFDCLPVSGSTRYSPDASLYPLIEDLSKAGYRVSNVQPYGRRIMVWLAWTFPQIRSNEQTKWYLDVCSIDFRPKPERILGSGKWISYRANRIENLLFSDLQRIAPQEPALLFQDVAKARLLSEFDWTSLALMTSQEARQARIEFIRAHPHLISDSKCLAQALKDAGLYGPDTSLHQIRKFLESLIKDSGVRKNL